MIRIISLGAGVQSTTMALMAAHGEIGPMPDAAIFADTGWEPKAVYEHLDWLCGGNVLPFPVFKVSAGNLREQIGEVRPNGKWRKVKIPAFSMSTDGKSGIMSRSCTKEFKIDPIRRQARKLAGLTGKRSPKAPVVEQWIGISTDEAIRMKPAGEDWQVNRWPLIEQRMSRNDCLRWMERHGYPQPPKSSCIGCPFHSNAQWAALTPDEMADAVLVDRLLRDDSVQPAGTGALYLHASRKPLEEIDFHAPSNQLDLWGNECEGVCGV